MSVADGKDECIDKCSPLNKFVDLKSYPRLPEIKFVSSTGCELAKTEAEVPLGRLYSLLPAYRKKVTLFS